MSFKYLEHSVPFLSLLANADSGAATSEEQALDLGDHGGVDDMTQLTVDEDVGVSSGRKQKRPRKFITEETAGGGKGKKQMKGVKRKRESQPTQEDVEAEMLMKELSRDEARRRRELFSFASPAKNSSSWVRNKLPQHLKRLMGEANMSFAKGQHEEAIRLCKEIIRQAPKVAEPFQTLAMVYEDRNDLEKFFEISMIAAHLKRTDTEQWVKLAEMSVERNDLKRAVNCFSQAIRYTKGVDVELLWQRAGLYHKNGQCSKAMDDCELIKKTLPVSEHEKLFQVAVEMAKLHNELGNTTKAIEVLQEAFSHHPHNIDPNAINLLAELAMSEENYDLACYVICSNCGIECCPANSDNQQSHGEENNKGLSEQARLKDGRASGQQGQNTGALTELIPVAGSMNSLTAPEMDLAMMEQLMVDVPRIVQSEICQPGVDVLYHIPDYLPIDLRGKLVVCLIHGGQQKAAENAAQPLESEDPNEIGDIYLDIVEAYIKKGHPDWALKWLSSLIQTETFNQAGVWLQHAECLVAIGQLEEAANSYEHVVALAPRHLDARLALSLLYQQLNRPDQALQALTQIDESWEDEGANEGGIATLSVWQETAVPEYVPKPPPAWADTKDYKLLLHKSMLLFEQGKQAEFVDCGLEMLSYFFRNVYYIKNLREICLYSDRKIRSETRRRLMAQCSKGESEGELNLKSKEADWCDISEEEWWDLFIKVATALLHLGRLPELRHLAMACSASFRFTTGSTGSGFTDRVRFACGLSCLVCQEYHLAFEYLRVLCQKYPSNVPLWNIMGQLFCAMPDKRTHKFVLRLLLKVSQVSN
jgi:general transcription factor 3C polypeptide 3 (transcription factor C subunit 4)